MNTSTLAGHPHGPGLAPPPDRALPPRVAGWRPEPTEPPPVPDLRTLETRRSEINRAALAHPGPLYVVLYALIGPERKANADLAAARGYAEAQHLVVVGSPLVDALDSVDARTGGEDPLLRRNYSRVRQMVADPACAVRGVVAVSRTAITPAVRLYQDQLTWYADRRAGLWLVRGETEI
ncbi:hypothetical protein [Streptomyces virginiae]|uniref:hypothetical protein n=1 Tax=Streptomyces virginiae TaxID=1961 RepID=UPI00369424FA